MVSGGGFGGGTSGGGGGGGGGGSGGGGGGVNKTTASQAWSILKRHARDEISPLRLKDLCRDNDRVSNLVSVHNGADGRMLLVDLSRQRMTLETLNHLLRLAATRDIHRYITRLAWGQYNDPENPVVPSRIRNQQQKKSSGGSSSRSFDTIDQTPSRRKLPPGGTTNNTEQQQHRPTNNTDNPRIPSFHLSLRVPDDKGYEMFDSDGNNLLTNIHMEWDRIRRISDSLRRGQLPGVTGSMIRDVVVIGRGVSIMALRFVYLALCKDHNANVGRQSGISGGGGMGNNKIRRMKFITSVDPVRAASVVADSDPASTLVISISIQGTNEETTMTTKTLKSWLLQSLGSSKRHDVVLSHHMLLVTGNERIAAANKPESVFLLPEHSRSEPYVTFTAATLLPLSIVFGWPIVEHFLAGAHSMDCHFVETNPRHNLPILLALTDIWNDSFLGSNGRIISPYTEAFAAYPSFVACLESQTCGGGASSKQNNITSSSSSLVIDGGLHSAYDRTMYLGGSSSLPPSELVMTMDSQLPYNAQQFINGGMNENVRQAQDALICSMFAHADELAFGTDHHYGVGGSSSRGLGSLSSLSTDTTTIGGGGDKTRSDGNHPSTLLVCGICDAFACGELVALAEHRSIVKARILEVDPFAKESGSVIRSERTEKLKESLQEILATIGAGEDTDDDDDHDGNHLASSGLNLSTKTILRHYASQVKDHRVNKPPV